MNFDWAGTPGILYRSQPQINETELSSPDENLTSPVTYFVCFSLNTHYADRPRGLGSCQKSLEIISAVVKSSF